MFSFVIPYRLLSHTPQVLAISQFLLLLATPPAALSRLHNSSLSNQFKRLNQLYSLQHHSSINDFLSHYITHDNSKGGLLLQVSPSDNHYLSVCLCLSLCLFVYLSLCVYILMSIPILSTSSLSRSPLTVISSPMMRYRSWVQYSQWVKGVWSHSCCKSLTQSWTSPAKSGEMAAYRVGIREPIDHK